jgi:RNA polymerase sigma factor (sigma-70 family)
MEAIYRGLSPIVAGYLRAQRAHEPDDLTSEVFLGVLRNLERFQGDEPAFRSWVFTIAHRRLVDERRRHVRQPVVEPLSEAGDRASPDDVARRAEERLGAERVVDLCARLVPDQRDVLLLRWIGGLTVREVALALGKTSGAVKALQRRGIRAVSRLLEREGVPL